MSSSSKFFYTRIDNFQTVLVAMVSVSILACGLTRYDKKYATEYNRERAKRGIPTIPSIWKIRGIGKGNFDCISPDMNMDRPQHFSKRVFVNKNGMIAAEEDAFYSGKSFFDPADGTLPQTIHMRYDYAREKSGNPWTIYTHLGPPPDHGLKEVTLQEADEILKSWGLSR